MSLELAIGAVFGFLILGQALSWSQIGGVLLVIAASVGAVLLPVVQRPGGRKEIPSDDFRAPELIHQQVGCTMCRD